MNVMKMSSRLRFLALVLIVLFPKGTRAQGTIYLSNLNQPSFNDLAVSSDGWVAFPFLTGANPAGYTALSLQLDFSPASGTPDSFAAMFYASSSGPGATPADSLGTLNGSANPATGGLLGYTAASDLTFLPNTEYFVVLHSGTPAANGTYEWNEVGESAYNPADGWNTVPNGFLTSTNGSNWSLSPTTYPQLAIAGEAVPEPGVLGLLAFGGLIFFWVRHQNLLVVQTSVRPRDAVQSSPNTPDSWQ